MRREKPQFFCRRESMPLSRRAQMEMIGLVFVVLIIIIGIVLYVSFSSRSIARPAKEIQTYSSFMTAFGETDVPGCDMSAAKVAEACADEAGEVCGGDPCSRLQDLMDMVLGQTLDAQGIRYNMSLEGTPVGRVHPEFGCASSYTAILPGTATLKLAVCLR